MKINSIALLLSTTLLVNGFTVFAQPQVELRKPCPWCGGVMQQINRKVYEAVDCPVAPDKKDYAYEYIFECKKCGDIDTYISDILCTH